MAKDINTVKTLTFNFRWPVNQTSEHQVEVKVPVGLLVQVINEQFAQDWGLSDAEYHAAETAVLETVAIVK